MKVIILNSGLGRRMGELTEDKPKCLVEINDELILERQLRILSNCQLEDIVITTGPFKDKIEKFTTDFFPNLNFTFINNDAYDSTNYIYSMYLLKELDFEDILLFHGDLVFSEDLLNHTLQSDFKDLALISKEADLPDKDFKAEICNNEIKEIGVNISGDNLSMFMPFYKLTKGMFSLWMKAINDFIKQGKKNVYAEEALNNILANNPLNYYDFKDEYCMEIDNPNDLKKAKELLRGRR